jgi:hypothetical protein
MNINDLYTNYINIYFYPHSSKTNIIYKRVTIGKAPESNRKKIEKETILIALSSNIHDRTSL